MPERPHIPEEVAETPEEQGWFASKPREFVDEEIKHEQLQAAREYEVRVIAEAIEETVKDATLRVKRLGRNAMLAGVLFGGTSFATPAQSREAILEASRTSEAWEGLPSEEQMLGALRVAYGRDAVREMLPTEGPERRDWGAEPIAEVGDDFERFGIDHAAMRELLENGYPRFMTARDTVSRITYRDERYPVPASYGLRSDAHALASCANAPGREAAVVTYYRDAFEPEGEETMHDMRIDALRHTLPHELAHAVDWEDMADIDPTRRMEILYRLTQLVQDEQHMLRFGYAEHIENPDPQERLRHRATEYFADLVAAVIDFEVRDEDREQAIFSTAHYLQLRYDRIPEELERLPPQDPRRQEWEETMQERTLEAVRLVYDYVHAVDPEFDFVSASLARERILQEMEEAHLEQELGDLLGRLPPRVREAMESTRRVSSEGTADRIVHNYLDSVDYENTPSQRVFSILRTLTHDQDPRAMETAEVRRMVNLGGRAIEAERRVAAWISERYGETYRDFTDQEHGVLAPLIDMLSTLHLHDQREGNVGLRAYDLTEMREAQESLRPALAANQPADADPFADPIYPERVIVAMERIARLYTSEDPMPPDLAEELEEVEREVAAAELAAMPD